MTHPESGSEVPLKQEHVARKVGRGLTFNFLRTIVSLVTAIAYSIIAVRWLGVDDFGMLIFLDSVFSLLGTLYFFGIPRIATQFIPMLAARKDYPRVRMLIRITQRLVLVSSFVVFLAVFILADQFASVLGHPEYGFFIRLMSLRLVPGALLRVTKNILEGVYDQKFLSTSESIFSLSNLGLLVLFVVMLGLGPVGIILLSIISHVSGFTLFQARLRLSRKSLSYGEVSPLGEEMRRRILKYVAPIILLGSLNLIISQISNIFLGIFKSIGDVTYFDVSYTMADRMLSQIWLIIGTMGLVSLVEIRTIDPTRIRVTISQYVKLVTIYSIPVIFGGFILAEPILFALYGEKMLPAILPFQILIIFIGVSNLFAISIIVMYAFEKTRAILVWQMVRISLLLLLNLLLIPIYGIMGAILALVISSTPPTIAFTYKVMKGLNIGNFIPLRTIGKSVLASSLMYSLLLGLTLMLDARSPFVLVSIILIGFLAYIAGLRLFRAFDETDREMLWRSNVPLKKLIIKFFW